MKHIKSLLTIISLFTITSCGQNLDSSTVSSTSPEFLGISVNKVINQLTSSKNKEKNRDISELVNYKVNEDETVKYYVNPGETFRLHVSLSNPSKYEIQSITLNGKKYASYMFAEDSNLENIYIEMTAPDQSGYEEYHLDSMKYLENTSIKDVEIKQNNSLSVGVKYSNTPNATLDNFDITATTFKGEIKVDDPNMLIQNNPLDFYISDGEKIIYQKKLEVGNNDVELSSLDSGSSYQVGVVTQLDLADGRNLHTEWLLKDEFSTDNLYEFDNISILNNCLTFDINKKYSVDSTIDKIDLMKGDEVIDSISSNDNYYFSNLLSSTTYSLALHYTYSTNKESEVITTFKTDNKKEPSFNLTLLEQTSNSLTIEVDSIDENSTAKSYSLCLYDESGNKIDGIKEDDTYKFTSLLSEHTYQAYLDYTYDTNDGKGTIKKSLKQSFSTLKNNIPKLSTSNKVITANSITLDYSLDSTLAEINNISLYKEGNLINSTNESKVSFTDLESDTDYTIEVNYSYDLNDGKGKQNKIETQTYHTSPELSIVSCEIINQKDSYVAGDSIDLKITFDNKNNLKLKSLTINESTCSLTYNNNLAYTSYTLDKNYFHAGDNTIYISNVFAKDTNNNSYTYEYKDSKENSFTLHYSSAMYVDGIKQDTYSYCNMNEDYKVYFDLVDLDNQILNNAVLSDSTKLKINNDDNGYYILLPTQNEGLNTITISSIEYTSGNEELTLDYSKQVQYYVLDNSKEYISVKTIDDFNNMVDGNYYRLDSDLDFSSITHTPKAFKGVFDGNNHTIKNLILNGIENASYGLFSTLTGYVSNLNFDNCIIYSKESTEKNMGFLAGSVSLSLLRQIEIKNTCYIKNTIKNVSINIGGLVGSILDNASVEDCKSSPLIQSSAKDTIISGLIGSTFKASSKFIYLRRNESSPTCATISSTFAGVISDIGSSSIDVEDMLVDINYQERVDQITGVSLFDTESSGCNVFINHYIDSSSTKCIDYSSNLSGEIRNSAMLLHDYNMATLPSKLTKTNSYASDYYYNGETNSVKMLRDINTYTNIMKFDTDIWTFKDMTNLETPILNRK